MGHSTPVELKPAPENETQEPKPVIQIEFYGATDWRHTIKMANNVSPFQLYPALLLLEEWCKAQMQKGMTVTPGLMVPPPGWRPR